MTPIRIVISALGIAILAGCASSSAPTAPAARGDDGRLYHWESAPAGDMPAATAQAKDEQAVALASWPSQQSDGSYQWLNQALPTGRAESSVIGIEKGVPFEARLNQAFDYEIIVTNLSDICLENVMVYDRIFDGLKLVKSEPEGTLRDDNRMTWTIGQLAPEESKTILITAMATSPGALKTCATASYDEMLCSSVSVVQPELRITMTGPAEALLCDELEYRFDVFNSGTGAIENVRIDQPLPDGLTTANGAAALKHEIGRIEAGAHRTFSLKLKAGRTGNFEVAAKALGDGDLSATSSAVATVITRPKLTITTTGPERRFLGQPADYQIVVTNVGDGAARDLFVEETLPAGAQFVDAGQGGQRFRDLVRWELGTLRPGESRELKLQLNATEAIALSRSLKAFAYCADEVRTGGTTMFEGIPAILLEVIDLKDPVRVGEETTYVITATNQGSAPGTNIRIACELEANLTLINATGATPTAMMEGKVSFRPLESLAPGQKAVWQLRVKAMKPGDVRFKVMLHTDQFERPVEETEATNIYQ